MYAKGITAISTPTCSTLPHTLLSAPVSWFFRFDRTDGPLSIALCWRGGRGGPAPWGGVVGERAWRLCRGGTGGCCSTFEYSGLPLLLSVLGSSGVWGQPFVVESTNWVNTHLCVSAHPPFLMILWFTCICIILTNSFSVQAPTPTPIIDHSHLIVASTDHAWTSYHVHVYTIYSPE